jgi:putative membrane protein
MSEVFVSYLHYLGFATLLAALAIQLVLFRPEVTGDVARRLARIDALYGFSALVVLGTGLLRLLVYGKPASYYMQNGLFHVKLTLFVVAFLLSVYPTIHYLRNRRTPDDGYAVYPAVTGVLMRVQLLFLLVIPLLAVLMSRGYGYKG